MNARPPTTATPAPPNMKSLAVALLATAAEVEAAEAALKKAIIAAARIGDTKTVIDIVSKWQVRPPVDIAKNLPKPP